MSTASQLVVLMQCHSLYSFTMAKWGKAEDAKLANLFKAPRNLVNPRDLSIEAVKAVHKKYFSDRNYNSFAPLYRAKARAFEVGKSLEGHRESKLFFFLLVFSFHTILSI